MRQRQSQTRTLDFKPHALELYLTTEVSYQELALQIGMNNLPIITKWISD